MSPGPIPQPEDQAHRAVRVGEARDLVVDQACRKPGIDDVGVADLGTAALRPYDPDGAVRLDPSLDVLDSLEILQPARAHENEIDRFARSTLDHVGSPSAKQRHEAGV